MQGWHRKPWGDGVAAAEMFKSRHLRTRYRALAPLPTPAHRRLSQAVLTSGVQAPFLKSSAYLPIAASGDPATARLCSAMSGRQTGWLRWPASDLAGAARAGQAAVDQLRCVADTLRGAWMR